MLVLDFLYTNRTYSNVISSSSSYLMCPVTWSFTVFQLVKMSSNPVMKLCKEVTLNQS
jgi:hypothetical protein